MAGISRTAKAMIKANFADSDETVHGKPVPLNLVEIKFLFPKVLKRIGGGICRSIISGQNRRPCPLFFNHAVRPICCRKGSLDKRKSDGD
jgi:hypothetical protein